MPINYNPGIQYRGDQYLYQGISGAGEALGAGVQDYLRRQQEAKQEMELQERQDIQNRIILQHAEENQLITPEQLKEFQFGNAKQRDGIASGLSATIATKFALGQQQQKAMYQAAQMLNLGANTRSTNVQTDLRLNPPTMPQPRVVNLPNESGEPSGVNAVVSGDGKPQILPPQVGQKEWSPSSEKLEEAKKFGLGWFPAGPKGNGYWQKDPNFSIKNDSLAQFSKDTAGLISVFGNKDTGELKNLPADLVQSIQDTFSTRLNKLLTPAPGTQDRPNAAVTTPNSANAANAIRESLRAGQITREEAKAKLLELGYN